MRQSARAKSAIRELSWAGRGLTGAHSPSGPNATSTACNAPAGRWPRAPHLGSPREAPRVSRSPSRRCSIGTRNTSPRISAATGLLACQAPADGQAAKDEGLPRPHGDLPEVELHAFGAKCGADQVRSLIQRSADGDEELSAALPVRARAIRLSECPARCRGHGSPPCASISAARPAGN